MIFSPNDSLISPIVHELALIASNQIQGVSVVYEQPIDGPPEDNSVTIPLNTFKVLDDTNGKLLLKLSFGIRYTLRRASFPDNLLAAYAYIPPFLQAYSSWQNQTLNGLSRSVTCTTGGVTQMIIAGQAMVCLVSNVDVLLEYNIPTGA